MTVMTSREAVKRALALGFALAAGLSAGPGALAADAAKVFEEKCAICHGADGASKDSSIPIIGGYSAKYVTDSVKNFRKKLRPCAEVTVPSGPKKGTRSDMCKVVAELADADAEAVGRWLAGRKFVRARQPFDAAKATQGGSVYRKYCNKCHENNGASPDEDNGILAGQWTPYLKAQLASFRAGKRAIDEKMKLRLDKVGKEDEEALLHFFASQQ
jgi:sulfide dehydrogenase cytochrome subunit